MFRPFNRIAALVDGRASQRSSARGEGRALWRTSLALLGIVLLSWSTAFAQGRQTGTIVGTVTDRDGLVIPGAVVTVSSDALQGVRSTTTDGNGNFTIPLLPSGEYVVRIELAGMKTIEQRQRVDLGLTARVDAQMQLDSLTEIVTVVSATPSVVTAVSTGANYRGEMIDKLASPRTIQGVAELAPGLTDNTPNAGQVTIGGGFAYDNQFLVDGVDVADNLFGTANNLFIEDAIEEVQVLTSGISAEYGRFGGGVVQAITKSGSNRFAGSFRNNQYKPSWTTQTPFEKSRNLERTGDVQNIQEWTLGGPVLRDRLWFFHAGRRQSTTTPAPFQQTGIANSNTAKNDRFEIKGTGTLFSSQTLQAQFIREPDRAGAAVVRLLDRPVDDRQPHAAEQPGRRQLARRAQRQAVRHGPGLAPQVRLRRLGRHQHQHPRLAIPDPRLHLGRARRRCTTTRPTSTRLTRRTGTTARSPAR